MAKKKKTLKAEQQYTAKQLEVLARFKMGPVLDLSKKDAELIDAVAETGDISFFSLCDRFDEKPSKIYKRLSVLQEKNLVVYSTNDEIVKLTPLAVQFMGCRLKDGKPEKKFRKFLESLNEEELDRFIQLIDQFKIDESLCETSETEKGSSEPAEEEKEEQK